MTISEYLSHLDTLYFTGNAREHSDRRDLQTYQKMIAALTETDRLMKEIDEVGVVGKEQKVTADPKL